MKKTTTIFTTLVIVVLCAIASTSFAQATATLSASATIVMPVSMEKLSNLQVTIPANNTEASAKPASRARRSNNNVVAASFTVSGYAHYAYGVTLPSSITISSGNKTITIGTSVNSSARSLSENGTDAISVGGTFKVDASQVVAMNDKKSDEVFPVTVVYN